MKLARPFLMPKLGLTMTEGLVAEWRIGEGDRFAASDVLVVIETDKVAHEIEAPADGHLLKIIVPAGDTVPISTELGKWSLDGFADASSVNARAGHATPGYTDTFLNLGYRFRQRLGVAAAFSCTE